MEDRCLAAPASVARIEIVGFVIRKHGPGERSVCTSVAFKLQSGHD